MQKEPKKEQKSERKAKKANYRVWLDCQVLGIGNSLEGYSEAIDCVARERERKINLTGSHAEFYTLMASLWNRGHLTVNDPGTFREFVRILHRSFRMTHVGNAEEEVTENSLESMLRRYRAADSAEEDL